MGSGKSTKVNRKTKSGEYISKFNTYSSKEVGQQGSVALVRICIS
jgi:hypothetical protein